MKKKSKAALFGVSGILVLCLGCVVVVGGIVGFVYLITLPLRANPGMVQGMQIIKNDPAVAELFGSPVRQSLIIMGTLKTGLYGSGYGNLWTPISGPHNNGEADIYVTKPEGGQWQLESMSIRINRKLVLVWDADQAGSGFRKQAANPNPAGTPMPPATAFPSPTTVPPPTAVPPN
jgi:hypothetical protein